jgi:hypothetical protein
MFYSGPLVIQKFGQFWANYSPPPSLSGHGPDHRGGNLHSEAVDVGEAGRASQWSDNEALRSYTLALGDDFLYVTYTTEFALRGPDSRVMRTTPPPYSPNERQKVSF